MSSKNETSAAPRMQLAKVWSLGNQELEKVSDEGVASNFYGTEDWTGLVSHWVASRPHEEIKTDV